jgi:RNA polymerase sigma-70 factor (ECF subfamily)
MDCTERIWQAYHNELHRFIRSRVSDPATADDILQDVFLRIHSRIETLNNCDKVQSWVFQIARNAVVDHYRARKDSTELPETIPDGGPDSTEEALPEAETCRMDNCMLPMIQSLPDKYRDAVIMAEIDGLPQKQIAEKLGISLSGAKSRVQRGRAMMKGMLLDCCRFDFDRRGNVIDYDRRKPAADAP